MEIEIEQYLDIKSRLTPLAAEVAYTAIDNVDTGCKDFTQFAGLFMEIDDYENVTEANLDTFVNAINTLAQEEIITGYSLGPPRKCRLQERQGMLVLSPYAPNHGKLNVESRFRDLVYPAIAFSP